MSVLEIVRDLGGVATWGDLIARTNRTEVRRAIMVGDLVRDARGRFALPDAEEPRRQAHRFSGVISHLSAAEALGWAIKRRAPKPHLIIPRNRKLRVAAHEVVMHYADLAADEVNDGVTSMTRTLVDCLRTLPFDEGLSVADSALRTGAVTPSGLEALARGARGRGAGSFKRAAAFADPRSSGPFESVLRSICLTVPGLRVEPQVRIGDDEELLGRPDLVDLALRLVIEADSFAWHGHRAALKADARRYNAFTASGWTVLRFTWEDVMLHPSRVWAVLDSAAQRQALQLRVLRRVPLVRDWEGPTPLPTVA